MNIEIYYCNEWNYFLEASRLEAELLEMVGKEKQLKISLTGKGGGIFDVYVDGKLIYSKFETGRYPTTEEIINFL